MNLAEILWVINGISIILLALLTPIAIVFDWPSNEDRIYTKIYFLSIGYFVVSLILALISSLGIYVLKL